MLRRAAPLLILAGLLTATAACGARWSDQERAAVHARGQGGTVGAEADDSRSHANGAVGVIADGDAASVDPTAAGPSATTPSGDPSGPAPCGAASGAPGVTDGQIRIGSISSLSGPVPGLAASAAAGTRAYIAYLNANGGVCGRQVVLKEGDDGTEGGRYRTLVTRMAEDVLGLAGGFALGDVGGLDEIRATNLPVVTAPGDDRGTALPSLFDINPPFESESAVTGKYQYLYGQGVRTATQVYLAVTQSRVEAQRQRKQMEAVGIRIVDVQELPLATLSYDAAARRAVNSGAQYLFFIGDARGNGSMARSMHGAGSNLQFEEYFTFSYGEGFIEQAGAAAAEGSITWLRSLPNEEASTNAELARFQEWMDRTAPGTVRDAFAVDGWVGAKAFFGSLQALPGPISREALVAQLRAVDTFDAGGMFGPIRLGAELNNGCVVGMRVQGGAWRRMAPASGFLC